MKTTLTRENAATITLAVEASADEVAPAIEKAVRKLGGEVKIPGFRKGHVPRKVLETRLGRDALKEATLREAVPMILAKAVEEESLQPIAPPSVNITGYDLDAELLFDATVEVRPEITLPDFHLLSATRTSTEATDEEIAEQLTRLQDRFATLDDVSRPARAGDFAQIDIFCKVNDQDIEQLSGKDQLYEVGSGFPIAELDSELDGKSVGDIVKFNATIPESLGIEEFGGKEVTFTVFVKQVKQKVVPTLDDEFAKTSSEFETLDELRNDVAERIAKVKAVQADADVRNKVLEQVLDDVEVDLPQSLVQDEMAYRIRRLDEQLRGGGLTLERYMEMQGITEEQLEADLRAQAERNVKAQLILEEIGKREGFTVSEDELREEVRFHAETLRMQPQDLAKQLDDRGRLLALAGDIIRRKALNHLVEKAEITQEGAAPDAGAEEGEQS
jgi:trigger factor